MKNVFKSILSLLIASSFFFIANFENHRAEPPRFIGSIVEPFNQEGIYIQAKAYDAQDSKTYLSRDLLRRGFQPIQVTIQNNTSRTFYLSNQGLDLPNATAHTIASRISREAIPRAVIFKVIGFFFPPFLVVGTVDGIVTVHAHFKMKNDYHAKSIKDTEKPLLPYSTVHRVIFVPNKEYTGEFNLYLKQDRGYQYTPFHVIINS